MQGVNVTQATLVSALGRGRRALRTGLDGAASPLRRGSCGPPELPVGAVSGVDDVQIDPRWRRYDCRNNRLAELALATDDFEAGVAKAVAHYGAARVGLFVGTSTAGMRETEAAFQGLSSADDPLPPSFPFRECHPVSAPAEFLAQRLGLAGHTVSISTACSSSAKVFAAAQRSMQLGICDAAVVGGIDSLCRTTLYGFHALELTATEPCKPFAPDRAGLCIGEAAGLALLEPAGVGDAPRLLGYGESSDAHHMSTPHPQALGARLAIARALTHADVRADAVDYVNLHGTATPTNDAAEGRAVAAELGEAVPCSSTKGWTGHTLGAAGIVEAVVCIDVLDTGRLPATQNTHRIDEAIQCNVLTRPLTRPARVALSNSFGFGGSNCALLFGA